MTTSQPHGKRLIVCCDGTWMDCDSGYSKATLMPYVPAILQVPSNVTRIVRGFRRHSRDGKPQVIYYHSGVGAGGSMLDSVTGGMLGTGISENIREAYSFITTNYIPGDEIVLIGFSRGAFTARAVGGLIRDIGLLTREGMKDFFAIFKDTANRYNDNYDDMFPNLPFKDKPKGPKGCDEYREKLVSAGLTRATDANGKRICIQAIGVWDTVGSLGFPNMTIFSKLGLPHPGKELKFRDTQLDPTVQHGFQALALEEKRSPFSPAVWERTSNAKGSDLRQVWFPGSHSGVGGGYSDQEVSDVALAWMMDQLSSIGLSFKDGYIDLIHAETKAYYQNLTPKSSSCLGMCTSSVKKQPQPWASAEIHEKCHPVRPFGMGQIFEADVGIWKAAGAKIRTPGLYKRLDPDTGKETKNFLSHTNERIHPCVRVRLTMGGLGLDDKGPYKGAALMKNWAPRKINIDAPDPIGKDAAHKWGGILDVTNGDGKNGAQETDGKRSWTRFIKMDGANEGDDGEPCRWVWEYIGPENQAPPVTTMIEENLGPYGQRLLALDECEIITKLIMD